jgi:hypothetical protein
MPALVILLWSVFIVTYFAVALAVVEAYPW